MGNGLAELSERPFELKILSNNIVPSVYHIARYNGTAAACSFTKPSLHLS
jgi:hypothetical protein